MDRVQFSAAIFYNEYDDYQVNQLLELTGTDGLPSGTSYSIQNAAKVETSGAELESTILLSDNWTLSAAAAYLNAEFDSFPGGGPNGEDLAGNQLVRAPEFSGSIALDYMTEIAGFNFMGHIDYAYTDEVYVTEDNVKTHTLVDSSTIPFGYLESHALLNARLTLEAASAQWRVSLWGNNLMDEEYLYGSASEFLGTISEIPNMPRTYGVDLTVNF